MDVQDVALYGRAAHLPPALLEELLPGACRLRVRGCLARHTAHSLDAPCAGATLQAQ